MSNGCYFQELTTIKRNECKGIYEAEIPNTSFELIQKDKAINFLSKGGNQFSLPLDKEVKQIFPLSNGLLLGWGVNEFNYAVLLNHPIGQLSGLGTYNPILGTIEQWVHTQEEIIFVHPIMPILVAYNKQLQRHSVHILKIDSTMDLEKLNTQRFSLQYDYPNVKIISELYFEDNNKEDRAKQVCLIHGNNDGQILICILCENLKIFEMNLFEQTNFEEMEEDKKKNIFNTLKLVQIIYNAQSIQEVDTIKDDSVQMIRASKQTLKHAHNYNGFTAYQILNKNRNKICHNLLVSHYNTTFTLLNGSRTIISYNLLQEVKFIPQINCKLLQIVVKALRGLLDSHQYSCLLKDVILNCLNTPYVKFDSQQQDLQSLGDEFQRFTYLMMFYLKLCGNRNVTGDDLLQKRIKRDSNQQTPIQSPTRENQGKNFNKLLQSDYHKQKTNFNHIAEPLQVERKFISFAYHMTLEMFYEIQEKILYTLHITYQDLTILHPDLAQRMLYLLYSYSVNLDNERAPQYIDYYLRQNPLLSAQYINDSNISLLPSVKNIQRQTNTTKCNLLPPEPVDLMKWFQGIITNKPFSFPIVFKTTKQFCNILQSLIGENCNHISQIFKQQNMEFLHIFPQKLQYPIFYQQSLNPKAIDLFIKKKQNHREAMDLFKGNNLALYLLSKKNWNQQILQKLPTHWRLIILEIINKVRIDFPPDLMFHITKETYYLIDRMDLYKNCRLYNQAKKKCEFKKFVNSILSRQINLGNYEDQVEFKYDKNQLVQVKKMFDFEKDLRVKCKFTEHISEEKLDTEAPAVLWKLLQRKLSMFVGYGAFQYGTSEHFITDQIKFPQLNLSGILAQNSLRLTIDQQKDEYQNLTQWPEFHLGVSIALQLSQTLNGLGPESLRTWIFYQRPHIPSNIHGGFMLGLGLLGYMNSFNQIDLYQLLTQNHEATSVGVLIGIGASRMGTCDEATQKSLTVHIPTLIPSVYDLDLPSNVTTSAVCGIGLLYLQSGNRNFTEVALGLIGRKPMSDKVTDREGYSLAAGACLGLINLGKGSVWRRELQIEDRLIRFVQGGKVLPPPQSSLSNNFQQNENQISSIKEGQMVNIHVTCPAALVALSLMFLQTNQQQIVDKLNIPQSFSSLESCNPNHILLKAFAKNLIMWNDIPSTKEGVYQQIPELIRFLFEQPLKQIHQRFYIVYNIEVIDFMSVSMIYSGIIAGTILAIGVKYAGTHDEQLKSMMLQEFDFLSKLKITANEFANDPEHKQQVEQYTYYTNLVNVLQGISLLMAGSFDYQVLAIAKSLRTKMELNQIWHFGFHQAINMSIGLCHLGKGGYSFRKTIQAVGLLVLSVYPYYPSQTGDNKQFLQAFRWTYVMAIQPKIFSLVDVKTQQTAQTKAIIEYDQKNKEIFKVSSVKINDPLYWPLHLNLEKQDRRIQTIFIQSKCLTRIDQKFLDDKQIFSNLHSMHILNQYQSLKDKLKDMPELLYLNDEEDLEQYLLLFKEDNLRFIQILRELLNNKYLNALWLLEIFYKYQKQTVLKGEQIIKPFTEVEQTDIQLYIQKNEPKQLKDLYTWLQRNNMPTYNELQKIMNIVNKIPPFILEFYLIKTFPDIDLIELQKLASALINQQS